MILRPRGYLIDTNLIVLLAVGNESRDLISRHGRLAAYTSGDYDVLNQFLGHGIQLLATQNSLTEASNLIRQHNDPQRSQFLFRLRDIILRSQEIILPSSTASASRAFAAFGLADAVLFESATAETPLITTDAPLYRAIAVARGYEAAVNFAAYREL